MTPAATGAAERRGGCVLGDPPKNSVEYDGGRNSGLFRKKHHISYGYIQGLTPHAWRCTEKTAPALRAVEAYPTRVGMHRSACSGGPQAWCLPHTRGDAPALGGAVTQCFMLTPHAWGCTGRRRGERGAGRAYPTRVGMHPRIRAIFGANCCLPHTRGDAPTVAGANARWKLLTPHAWGCTPRGLSSSATPSAYPTRVGMHPSRPRCPRRHRGLPHTRGDAPPANSPRSAPPPLTPHAWGCTRRADQVDADLPAYPTRVGMHPAATGSGIRGRGLPHTRGDAPRGSATTTSASSLTPHAWGCTTAARRVADSIAAYPTRVGIHPPLAPPARRSARLPHTRGDAPAPLTSRSRRMRLTPHAWGCTRRRAVRTRPRLASPTRVGMHPPRR